MINKLFGLILLSSLAGCTNLNSNNLPKTENHLLPAIPINQSLYKKGEIKLVSSEAIFALSKKQRDNFLAFYQHQLTLNIKPHQALANFLDTRLSNFTYYGETFVAEKSMRLNKGNCMSLAILTAALAKTVNIEISYREVQTLPIFEKHKNVILSSSHVQALVYDPTFVPDKNFFYFNKPAIVIDYFPVNTNWTSKVVIKDTLLSKYYSNISAQFIVEGNLNAAFANAELAYQYDNSSSNITNLLAVLHRRKGDKEMAEKFYLRTIMQDKNNLNSLQNYAILLNMQQRYDELLKDLPIILPYQSSDCYSALHLYPIQLKLEAIKLTRRQVFDRLRAQGIGVNVHYIPVYQQPYYQQQNFNKESFPIADNYYNRAISLPLFYSMNNEQQNSVVQLLKDILQ